MTKYDAYFLLYLIFLVSCSSTKVEELGKNKYGPLDKNASVQVFDKTYPDLKYEELCKIKLERNSSFSFNSSASDYYDDLRSEARKCGANGVLVLLSSRFGRKISISATGIRIVSEGQKIGDEIVKKLVIATKTSNLKALNQLLTNVNKKRSKRSPSDTEMIDGLLYLYARKGAGCETKVINFFRSYESLIPKFNFIKTLSDGLNDRDIIFCKDVLIRSLPSVENKADFAIDLSNHFRDYMKYLSRSEINDAHFPLKLNSFARLFSAVGKEIEASCKQDQTSELCLLKSSYAENMGLLKNIKKKLKPRKA